jgi:hypothetical protein
VGAHRHGEITQAMVAEGHHGFGSIRFQIHLLRKPAHGRTVAGQFIHGEFPPNPISGLAHLTVVV